MTIHLKCCTFAMCLWEKHRCLGPCNQCCNSLILQSLGIENHSVQRQFKYCSNRALSHIIRPVCRVSRWENWRGLILILNNHSKIDSSWIVQIYHLQESVDTIHLKLQLSSSRPQQVMYCLSWNARVKFSSQPSNGKAPSQAPPDSGNIALSAWRSRGSLRLSFFWK